MVSLSKTLSYLLRHGAQKERLPILPDGRIAVDELLRHKNLRGATVEDVCKVVAENDKQRFSVDKDDSGRLFIRANQGHSIQVPELELQAVTNASELPICLHGTSMQAWHLIRTQGLKRGNRNHIHFAAGKFGTVTSGVRKGCEVLIYVDVPKAMQAGITFFQSANGVILSEGLREGILPPEFFLKAETPTGQPLQLASK
eukprot:jgi/Mesvir1/16906/Mv15775-RA.1